VILQVPIADLSKAWSLVEPLIHKGLERVDLQDRYTTDSIQKNIRSLDKQLWVATDGQEIHAALVTSIVEYPTGLRELEVFIAGGKDLDKWMIQAIKTFSAYGKAHQCTSLSGGGRKGWIKAISGLVPQYRFRLEI